MLQKLDHGHHVPRIDGRSLVARLYEESAPFLHWSAAAVAGDREEALRQASEMPRVELELIEKLDELIAAIGQSQN